MYRGCTGVVYRRCGRGVIHDGVLYRCGVQVWQGCGVPEVWLTMVWCTGGVAGVWCTGDVADDVVWCTGGVEKTIEDSRCQQV